MKRFMFGVLCCALMGTALPTLARDLTPPEKKIIMDVINGQLKDPDSAKYYWQGYKEGDIYCAHVNSKNSYGGYGGKTLIIMDVTIDAKGYINWAQGRVEPDPLFNKTCTKRGYSV